MLHALAAFAVVASSAFVEPSKDARVPLTDGTPVAVVAAELTSLAKYVAEDDGAYKWELVRTTAQDGVTIYDIRLTSQRWRTEAEVDFPVWTHWLTIGVPNQLKYTTPIMIIGGGRRRDEPREKPPGEVVMLVKASGTVVCSIDNVPNQPLKFAGDEQERFEDGILARTWNLAIEHDDARWIGRFPMVKAVKRAMDATQEFLAGRDLSPVKPDGQPAAKGFTPDGFFVTGASKRGWTTWLIAAVDPRVKAIAPVVIDVLNLKDQTPHHWASYGFWAPALKDYVANGIDKKFGTPELAKVIVHEDPAAYMRFLERMPKYIVTATGDEFFPTDSFQHYEKTLAGEWHLRSVPNAGHNLAGAAAPLEILAFYTAFVEKQARPNLTWQLTAEGGTNILKASINAKPQSVRIWQCDNPKARDFRLDQTGKSWKADDVSVTESDGSATKMYTCEAKVEAPATGYRAFMMEFTMPPVKPFGPSMVFTTRVFITPDVLPFASKAPAR